MEYIIEEEDCRKDLNVRSSFLQESDTVDKPIPKKAQLNSRGKTRANYGPKEGRRIFKNLFALSFSFILLFTAFFSMTNLQSSLNVEEGLGQYSLATIYVALTISSLFLPSLLIRKLSCKLTLVLAMIGYMIYIAAQFYPTFGTLIPAAVIIGLAAAPLWAAQAIYVKQLGEEYAFLTSKSEEVILQRFFGIFSLLFQSAQIWGSLIASLLLAADDDDDLERDYSLCGVNHCPAGMLIPDIVGQTKDLNLNSSMSDFLFGNNDSSSFNYDPIALTGGLQKPDMTLVYWLSGIYLVFSIAAAVCVWVFLDSLERYGENEQSEKGVGSGAKELILATLQNMKNPHQLYIIPLTIWTGLQGGFLGADFNLGFVSCAWGVKYIGYAMICFGITNGLSSIFFGRTAKYIGRPIMFIIAQILSFASIIILFTWSPNPDEPVMFLLIAGLWGLAEGVWVPQITALYGTIFPEAPEAAYSNLRLWNSVGFIIAYINGTRFCMEGKLYICIAVLTLGMIFYLILELKLRREDMRKVLNTKANVNNNLKDSIEKL